MKPLFPLALALAFALACGSGDTTVETPAAGSAAADASAAPAAPAAVPVAPAATEPAPPPAPAGPVKTLDLPAKVGGLKIDVPEGASVQVMFNIPSVSGGGLPETSIELLAPADNQPVEELKKLFAMLNPQNMKDEKLADGFVLTFENATPDGPMYFTKVVRTVGDKTVCCTSNNGKQLSERAAVVAACKSIRP